jgi:aldehyde dehydrogenase (NAD+)
MAALADKIHGETIPYLNDYTVYTLREPHGVTGHIIPWNYPMQILGRSVGAALAMGNAAVLKPAEEASLTALAFARIATDCGLPDGALNVVPGLGEEAGAALCAHPDVNHLSFTGSLETGRKVQQAAAQNVVPVTLELGGKSPQIVFADADLDRALPFLVNAGIQNCGQTCSASSRILVEASRHAEVVRLMSERYRSLTVGAAIEDQSVGPLISARQKTIVQGFLAGADEDGLAPVAEGQMPKSAPMGGHYVRPTLYGDVDPSHALARDEIFGPVQVIIPFRDEDEASPLPTAPITVLSPVCGPGMEAGRCGWRDRSAPARCSSTIMAPAAGSSCPSAVLANPAMAAKRVLRRSMVFCAQNGRCLAWPK